MSKEGGATPTEDGNKTDRPRRSGTAYDADYKLAAGKKAKKPSKPGKGPSRNKEEGSKKADKARARSEADIRKKGKTDYSLPQPLTTPAATEMDKLIQKANDLDLKLEEVEQKLQEGEKKIAEVHQRREVLIPADITDDEVFIEAKTASEGDIAVVAERNMAVKRQQELLDIQHNLQMRRIDVEHQIEQLDLKQREQEVLTNERMLELEERKVQLAIREQKIKDRAQKIQRNKIEAGLRPADEAQATAAVGVGLSREQVDQLHEQGYEQEERTRLQRTTQWVSTGGIYKTASQQRIAELESKLRQADEECKHLKRTDSQIRIAELESKLKEKNKEIMKLRSETRARGPEGGWERLRNAGLLTGVTARNFEAATAAAAMNTEVAPPTQAEKKKLGDTFQPGNQGAVGKEELKVLMCTGCDNMNERVKVSGKYAKSNVKIKHQEQWPHLSVMRKYCKRTTFDNLDYETFVAGESRIIAALGEGVEKDGRIKLLCKVSHWYCKCQDWGAVKGLYEAVLESIELGEETWENDFGHYETMVPCVKHTEKLSKEKTEHKEGKKDKVDLYWCKNYNKGTCTEKEPHMATLKNDETVPVVHICAYCWQKYTTRRTHTELDCTYKKEKNS